jgi:hypothetical protein
VIRLRPGPTPTPDDLRRAREIAGLLRSKLDLPPPPAGDHQEVIAAVRALRLGVRLVLVCAAFLVAAVGTTWYAPPKSGPFLQVGTACGTVTGTSNGVTTIRTATGTVQVPLTTATTIRPVQSCP